jgi:hypothetical protein
MIDANMERPSAGGELALDRASRRHQRMIGKKLVTRVYGTRQSKQPCGSLSPVAEILWGHKATIPKPCAKAARIGFFILESAFGIGFEGNRPTIRDQPALEIDVIDRALPDASVLTPKVRPFVITSQSSTGYELVQLCVGLAAAEVNLAS